MSRIQMGCPCWLFSVGLFFYVVVAVKEMTPKVR